MTFESLGVSAPICRAVAEKGYEQPMPVQEAVIPHLLGEPMDLIALAQTGTGKTAAFGLPLLLHHASGFIKGQLDRIIIYRMYSAAELGVYAAALQLAGILSIVLMAVNKATVPYYYHAIEQKKLTARRVRRWAWLGFCAAPLFAAAVWCMPESWFVWFLGMQYIGAHHYIVLFTLGYALTIPY